MKTQFFKQNPWTKQKMTKENTAAQIIQASDLSIGNDPLPTGRAQPEGKYTAIFAKLKPGQCIICPTGSANSIGQALRKWADANRPNHRVSATQAYPSDGLGRVWLLSTEKSGK